MLFSLTQLVNLNSAMTQVQSDKALIQTALARSMQHWVDNLQARCLHCEQSDDCREDDHVLNAIRPVITDIALHWPHIDSDASLDADMLARHLEQLQSAQLELATVESVRSQHRSRALDEARAEMDSLRLAAANLESDLRNAQEQLTQVTSSANAQLAEREKSMLAVEQTLVEREGEVS